MYRFKKAYIEITNVCNLTCEFCPKTKRRQEYMELKFFEHILDEIKDYCEYIYLHVLGEPLLHPNLEAFLDLCYEKDFKVNITTNGTLIKDAQHKLLEKKALRQINFSLHSFDANPHGFKVKSYEELMEEYLNNIFCFIKKAQSCSDLIVSLRLWNLQENSLHNDRNSYVLNKIENAFHLENRIVDMLKPGRGIKIAPKVYLNQASRFNWPDEKDQLIEGKGFCYGLKDQIAILVDGTVVPCCLDGEGIINLGNIKKTSFSEIIRNERSARIFEGFSKREVVEELCRKCTYRKRFIE